MTNRLHYWGEKRQMTDGHTAFLHLQTPHLTIGRYSHNQSWRMQKISTIEYKKSSICSVDPNANFHWHHLLLLWYSTPQLVYWINVHKDRIKRQNLGWYNDSDVLFGWGFAVQWTPCTVYCSIHILACSFSKNIKPIMPLNTVGIR